MRPFVQTDPDNQETVKGVNRRMRKSDITRPASWQKIAGVMMFLTGIAVRTVP